MDASLTSRSPGSAPEIAELLGPALRGPVLQSGDAGYDEARRVWNGMVDRRPAAIARCACTQDVRVVVDFARAHALPLAVRGGGHSYAGKSVCDGGLVLDLSAMGGTDVNARARVARVQGGATWAELDGATQEYGLATTGGVISHTGVAGLTLGGGVGYLARKAGLAVDNLLGADVVTAEGRLVRASTTENPDLFWALRGGGGNFGVVTSLDLRLHELGPEVLAGYLIHPPEAAADCLRFYRDFMATAPDELACYALFGVLPPTTPAVPKTRPGQTVLYLAVCYCGPLSEGEHALRPLRAFGGPLLDAIAPMPYTAFQRCFDAGQAPGQRRYMKALYIDRLPDALIASLARDVVPVPSPLSLVFLEALGGAVARVPPAATAFPHRHAAFSLGIAAGWTDPAEDATHIAWARALYRTLAADGTGVYSNYLDRDDGARVPTAYGLNYERLRRLKRRWDPNNLFQGNAPITPAAD